MRGASCEIVAIGTEMTAGPRVDTNSVWLRRRLADLDVHVRRVTVIEDEREALVEALRGSVARADLVITTGGLGPTEDDRTVEALSSVLDRPLQLDGKTHARLRERAAALGRPLRPEVAKMALVPRGATVLMNRRGSAPGLLLDTARGWIAVLPGVPDEMEGIVDDVLLRRLRERYGPRRDARAVLTLGGVWESDADRLSLPACREHGVEQTILAGRGLVELHLSGPPEAVDNAVRELGEVFGKGVISTTGASLESVVVKAAAARGGTLAVAESCTGGRIAARITSVPGASAVFVAGFVTYADGAKTRHLGVSEALIAEHGAVSEETVTAMVDGLAERTGCRWGVAVSGIAGPDGGTPDKPPGTVWIATTVAEGTTRAVRLALPGGRIRVQEIASGIALDLLRRRIIEAAP